MPAPSAAARDLARLRRMVARYGRGRGLRKRRLVARLRRGRLASAAGVHSLHEALCFLRAYPDDAGVLAEVEAALRAFDRRSDLRRHAEALASSGIAGTPTCYAFFFPTAEWLARRWPGHLRLDWDEVPDDHLLGAWLTLLGLPAEDLALDEAETTLRETLDALRGPRTPDGTWVVRRFAALAVPPRVRQVTYDALELPLRLEAGPRTPNRTRAGRRPRPVAFQLRDLDRSRPDLPAAVREAPRAVREVSVREGTRWIECAREAMVARRRDLEAFMHADPRDVRRVDFGAGLEFVLIGVKPERRLLLEAVYAALTVKNGVPIGYVLLSALFGSAAVAYNVFETWRQGESARVYGKVLALAHHLLGAETFSVDPFQLGYENEEGLESGAWWFYAKLGFEPRDAAVRRLAARERRRLAGRPGRRTPPETLEALSAAPVFYSLGRARPDVLGRLDLGAIGLSIVRRVAARGGADREAAQARLTARAVARLGVRDLARWPAAERAAFVAWAPLVDVLPGLGRFGPAARRALVGVIRAKGGRRESEFVRRFDAHPGLRAAVTALARRGGAGGA